MRILVADDDMDMVDMLTFWLKGLGYDVVRAFDGEQAIACWREGKPDLVILDVEMPKVDGFEVCRRMSGESNALVLMLTCRYREQDEVRGLELGADDYLVKPVSPRHLLARIRALARRATRAPMTRSNTVASVGSISLDPMRHEATRAGVKVQLTPTESRLLHLLLTHSGQVLPTEQIVERVWGYDDAADTGLVKQYIRHLRLKLEPEPNSRQFIVTVPGVGYTFMTPGTAETSA